MLKELLIDDLQEQHKEIANVIRLNILIKLSEYYGGVQLYIPQPMELLKELKHNWIREEFDGDNIRQLAMKYKVSESTVYRIIRDKISTFKNAPMEHQISLFQYALSLTKCRATKYILYLFYMRGNFNV